MLLCKDCNKCEKLVYKRVLKSGREIKFIYCKGNRNIIELYKWNVNTNKKRPEIYTSRRIDGHQRQITYFFHMGKNEVISPVDGNLLNFSLENLMGHEHVLGHGNYVVQNPIEDLKLYKTLMKLIMFKESY